MAESANPAGADQKTGEPKKPDTQEPTTVDVKEHEALKTKYTELEATHKATQGNLNRARNRERENSKLTGEVAAMRETLDVVMGALGTLPELDEKAKERIASTGQVQTQRNQQAQAIQKQLEPIIEILGNAGIDDWADPRAAEVVEAINDGDFIGARRMARNVGKQAKTVETTTAPNTQDIIKAEVDKALRAAGVREVDTGKGQGQGTGGYTKANLADKLKNMTTADILKDLAAINAAS